MNNKKYDFLIVGGGISGLVSACYLAKAGLSVLLVERLAKLGGCCSSFKRGVNVFDAFAHSLGGLSEGEEFFSVLDEIGVIDEINFERHDPSDVILFKDKEISFYKDISRTVTELSDYFPEEAENIKKFFKFLKNKDVKLSRKFFKCTFLDLLKENFKSKELKYLLSVVIFGNAGLPPSLISAHTAITLYREFIFDGGYYLLGGIQSLPDALERRLKYYGGEIKTSCSVIQIKDKNIDSMVVSLSKGGEVITKKVIASCDMQEIYYNLINLDYPNERISSLKQSLSMYTSFYGVNKNILEIYPKLNSTVWVMPTCDLEKIYNTTVSSVNGSFHWFLMHATLDKKGFAVSTLANFRNVDYWKKNKKIFAEALLNKVKGLIPNISKFIELNINITPVTIRDWTNNNKGSIYGWESRTDQFLVPGSTFLSPQKGVYLTGHWTTQTFGVSGVARLARSTVKRILKSNNIKA